MNESIEQLKELKAQIEATIHSLGVEHSERVRELRKQVRELYVKIEKLERPKKREVLRSLIGTRVSHDIWLSVDSPYHVLNGRSGILLSVDEQYGLIDFGVDEDGIELGTENVPIANIVIPSEAEGNE